MSQSTQPSKKTLYAIGLMAVFDAWLIIALACKYVTLWEWAPIVMMAFFGALFTGIIVAVKIKYD